LADFTKQPPARFEGWAFKKETDFYRDLGRPDVGALQANITETHKLGFVPQPMDVQKYMDLSFVDAANARLK
jgi:NitT/TauT family transport system substrate-binding protein